MIIPLSVERARLITEEFVAAVREEHISRVTGQKRDSLMGTREFAYSQP